MLNVDFVSFGIWYNGVMSDIEGQNSFMAVSPFALPRL